MEKKNTVDDSEIGKAVWHYVGIGTLWLALLLTGMALERLGLTSSVLAGVLPGETGMLREQASDLQGKLAQANRAYDETMRTKQALEVEVSKLRRAVADATAAAAAPASAPPPAPAPTPSPAQ